MKLNEINFDMPLVSLINKDDKSSPIYWQEKNRWVYWLMSLVRATNRYYDYSPSNCYTAEQLDFWRVVIICPRITPNSIPNNKSLSDQQIINSASKYKGIINRETIIAFAKMMENANGTARKINLTI